MKTAVKILQSLLLTTVLLSSGCRTPARNIDISEQTSNNLDILSLYMRYAPVKTNIMPLTEFISNGDTQLAHIDLYISLIDSFDTQIKSPGVFRFELYEYVPRSAEPKGGRVKKWDDYDLSDTITNNQYWRDFLRAYEFDLPFDAPFNQNYILRVTFLCPGGKRLLNEFVLRPTRSGS